ncbi:ADP-ribosylglycohydrolase family protein [Verrucomicrobiota bacterium sgz303538]
MIGAITGDIIGSVYEQQPIKTTEFPLWPLGCCFTDDTVLTVAVAEALLYRRDYGEVFREYYHRYPNAGYGGSFHRWARSLNPQPYGSWGNGSAMRVSPVGWFFNSMDDVVAEARRSAEVTHNHPEGIRGAECVAACIVRARQGASREELRGLVEDRFYPLQWTLDQLRSGYGFDVSCAGTVPVAVLAVLESSDFESAVRLAVSMGGDSDTLACIAGSIAEAFYGGVPAELAERTKLYLTPALLGVVEEFAAKVKLPGSSKL